MECNIYPQWDWRVYLHWASLGITHPVHRQGNSNQILTPQDVKYVMYNPSLAEGGCSLRELWVWTQEIKVQHLLINPASDFCTFKMRGVDGGRDSAGDSGGSGNAFWVNCNRKKKKS